MCGCSPTFNRGPLGYLAYFGKGDKFTSRPVVTWDANGDALIINHKGKLVVASAHGDFSHVGAAL